MGIAHVHIHTCMAVAIQVCILFRYSLFLDLSIQCSIVLIVYEFMGEESSQSIKHPLAREKRACKGNKQKDRIFAFS